MVHESDIPLLCIRIPAVTFVVMHTRCFLLIGRRGTWWRISVIRDLNQRDTLTPSSHLYIGAESRNNAQVAEYVPATYRHPVSEASACSVWSEETGTGFDMLVFYVRS